MEDAAQIDHLQVGRRFERREQRVTQPLRAKEPQIGALLENQLLDVLQSGERRSEGQDARVVHLALGQIQHLEPGNCVALQRLRKRLAPH
eukprot:562961-Prymnesium_polylepis.1